MEGWASRFSLRSIRPDISFLCDRSLYLPSGSANSSARTVFVSWPTNSCGFGCHPARCSLCFAPCSGFGRSSPWHLFHNHSAASRALGCWSGWFDDTESDFIHKGICRRVLSRIQPTVVAARYPPGFGGSEHEIARLIVHGCPDSVLYGSACLSAHLGCFQQTASGEGDCIK